VETHEDLGNTGALDYTSSNKENAISMQDGQQGLPDVKRALSSMLAGNYMYTDHRAPKPRPKNGLAEIRMPPPLDGRGRRLTRELSQGSGRKADSLMDHRL
jgi:hypothetical protein